MTETIRIMPCLDMQNGRVVKGVHFVDIKDAGDPVECARAYCAGGADELALLDITATVEGRATMLDVVRRVADAATVPFTVGGGIADVASAEAVLKAGADKVSISSAAFRKPDLVPALISALGAEKVTVAMASMQQWHSCCRAIISVNFLVTRSLSVSEMATVSGSPAQPENSRVRSKLTRQNWKNLFME